MYEQELLAQHEQGQAIARLRQERENLLDTVGRAISRPTDNTIPRNAGDFVANGELVRRTFTETHIPLAPSFGVRLWNRLYRWPSWG